MQMLGRWVLVLGLGLWSLAGQAQTVQYLEGCVVDAGSGEPVPFANVWVVGTQQGMMADENGCFRLPAAPGARLGVSSLGYLPKELASPPGSGSITIALESETTQLDEVVVKPEVPIARRIFNNIQEHKRSNRRHIQGLQDYQRLISTSVFLAVDTALGLQRLSHDLNDITIASGEERVRFSPVYLLEEAERVTPAGHETLMRRKESIFPRIDPAIEGYVLQNVVIELDFYQEQLPLFERGYISPIASSAPLYYDYYFNDSTQVGDSWHYHLSFVPKNRFHPLFTGNFWVEGDTWALTSVDAYISRDVNLNFVNGFSVATHYARRPEGFWFPETQNVRMNMSLTANTDSSGVYGAQRVDQLASGNWLVSKTLQYAVSERLADLKPELWKEAPEFGLPAIEEEAYLKVDRIRDIRVVRAVDAVGGMALTGYLNLGKVDLGPVFDIYTSNLVEGHRFGLPLRTSEKLWPHFSLGGFVAYGTRSEQVKYGGNLVWQPGESDRFILRAGFSDDYVLLAQDKYLRFIKNNPNDRGTSNFIGLFTAREKNPNLKEVQTAELRLEYNSDKDFHLALSPYLIQSGATPYVSFLREGRAHSSYRMGGAVLSGRYAFGQHYEKYYFDRIYYVSTQPVLSLSLDVGQSLLADGERPGWYAQLHASARGRINMGPVFMNYILYGGYLHGAAPYELLDQPVGSTSLGYSKDRYNLLHHASFAHNAYANLHMHLNGGGVLLNRLPLLRQLKLREIVSLKGHYGTRTPGYKGVFDLPEQYQNDFSAPYVELGWGLTNIFKVLRVEYVHQLGGTYRHTDFSDRHGIRFRAEMSF